MELVARHPEIDAIVYLGLGIQSNQARLMRDGRVLSRPRPRTDRRLPRAPGRPLRAGRGRGVRRDRQADPHRDRARGRRARQSRARRRCARPAALCYPSANRAVTALAHLWRYARFRAAPRPRLTRRGRSRPADRRARSCSRSPALQSWSSPRVRRRARGRRAANARLHDRVDTRWSRRAGCRSCSPTRLARGATRPSSSPSMVAPYDACVVVDDPRERRRAHGVGATPTCRSRRRRR